MREGEHQAETLLTFILSSRNDRYQGDSVWRLATTLNFLAANIEEAGESEAIEVIVTDWGSRTPLREALDLTSAARETVRFLEVAPDLAARLQGESPFPEVLANNAAIRRARGRFIGRIDQDTLVGKAFLVDFLAAVRNDPDDSLASSFLVWGRRSIPRRLTQDAPPLEEIRRFLESCGNRLPKEGRGGKPWFDMPVGIVILDRRVWLEVRGYDERLLLWGFMEAELALRIEHKYPPADMEKRFGCPFYHLRHLTTRLEHTPRRKNPRRRPPERPPAEDWGLAEHDLPMRCAEPQNSGETQRRRAQRTPRRRPALHYLPNVVWEWCWETALAAARRAVNAVSPPNVDVDDGV